MVKKHNQKEGQQILITKGSKKARYVVPGRTLTLSYKVIKEWVIHYCFENDESWSSYSRISGDELIKKIFKNSEVMYSLINFQNYYWEFINYLLKKYNKN